MCQIIESKCERIRAPAHPWRNEHANLALMLGYSQNSISLHFIEKLDLSGYINKDFPSICTQWGMKTLIKPMTSS